MDDRLGTSSVERLEALLALVADALHMDATIDVDLHHGVLTGRLQGDDLGPFIGRHGHVINAVQHLAQRIAPAPEDDELRIVVDADDYRERRAEALRADADHAAAQAIRTGRPVELDPMPPIERRVVHEYLREHDGVETVSEGAEPDRCLVVVPVEA